MYKDKFIRLCVEKMKILFKGSIFIATRIMIILRKMISQSSFVIFLFLKITFSFHWKLDYDQNMTFNPFYFIICFSVLKLRSDVYVFYKYVMIDIMSSSIF